jgi:hypothetical protein
MLKPIEKWGRQEIPPPHLDVAHLAIIGGVALALFLLVHAIFRPVPNTHEPSTQASENVPRLPFNTFPGDSRPTQQPSLSRPASNRGE